LSGTVKLDNPVGASRHDENFRAHCLSFLRQICARTVCQNRVCCQQVRNISLKQFGGLGGCTHRAVMAAGGTPIAPSVPVR
jgi:hypothetical protein